MGGFSIWHILIFAIILLLLFGGNRFSSMMGDVAKGLKSFKQGMADDDEKKADPRQLPPQQPIDVTPRANEPVTPPPPPPPSDDANR
jgi:sec-independent protein translocase protein TatA